MRLDSTERNALRKTLAEDKSRTAGISGDVEYRAHRVKSRIRTKLTMAARSPIATVESVAGRIHVIRRQKVMFDADLASLYGVTTKRFNEQVRRNLARFPGDFMFQLTEAEHTALRSQIATSNTGRGGRRYAPYVFSEHGAIMAATILNSPRATEMSVFIVRAFVQLREALVTHKQVAQKLDALERKVSYHDKAIAGLIDAIRQLMMPSAQPRRPIGFTADIEKRS